MQIQRTVSIFIILHEECYLMGGERAFTTRKPHHAQPDALAGEIIGARFSFKKDGAHDQVILLRYGPGKSQEIICFDAALRNDNNSDVHIFHRERLNAPSLSEARIEKSRAEFLNAKVRRPSLSLSVAG